MCVINKAYDKNIFKNDAKIKAKLIMLKIIYEGRLKSFEPNIKTSNFSVKFNFIFPHSLLLSRYIFPSDAPTPLIHSNNTERLALQNRRLRMR